MTDLIGSPFLLLIALLSVTLLFGIQTLLLKVGMELGYELEHMKRVLFNSVMLLAVVAFVITLLIK